MADVAVLERENALLRAQCDELLARLREKEQEEQRLLARIQELLRKYYGPRSERLSPGQLSLEFFEKTPEPEPLPQAQEAPDDEGARPRAQRRGRHGRQPLPRDLRRDRVEYHPEQRTCLGCGLEMRRIGEEVTEELDYVPASVFIREHARIKYACPKCQEGVAIAPLPERPLERGRPGPGLLAQVVVSKYGDHLPLYRQEEIFRRQGLSLSRTTLCDWVADTAELLVPIVVRMKADVLASQVIQSDDTLVEMQLNHRRGGRKRCYLWVYLGDQHDIVYDFTTSRSRAGPLGFLGEYGSYVQVDAYAGYDEFFARGRATEVGCWAHARRYFVEAMQWERHSEKGPRGPVKRDPWEE